MNAGARGGSAPGGGSGGAAADGSEPDRAEPDRARPDQTEPARAGHGHAGSAPTEPDSEEPVSANSTSAKSGNAAPGASKHNGTPFAGLDVVILHDPVPQDAPPDRQDTLTQARDVARALERLGCAARLLPFGPDLDAMRRELSHKPPRLAVNLVESMAGLERLAFAAPALLTALGIPCTGSGAQALLAASGKSEVKRRLRQTGLATPDWLSQSPRQGDPVLDVAAAALFILKPEHTHGSVGIGPDAVAPARDAAHLAQLLAQRAQALGQPCLAEAFVPGREFSVAVIAGPNGPQALPPAEMGFFGPGPAEANVLTYAAKWQGGSAAYADTRRAFPAEEPELLTRLAEAALAVWRVFGLAGYARLDFRVGPDGAPQIIDVNANPCLAEDAGLAAAARQAGLDFTALARASHPLHWAAGARRWVLSGPRLR